MAAYGVELGLDLETALRLSNAFGGGMGKMGEVCGAVTGAFMILGLIHGTADPDDEQSSEKTYDLVCRFSDAFRARHKTILCRELLGFHIGEKEMTPSANSIILKQCPGYVKDAAEFIDDILYKEQGSSGNKNKNS